MNENSRGSEGGAELDLIQRQKNNSLSLSLSLSLPLSLSIGRCIKNHEWSTEVHRRRGHTDPLFPESGGEKRKKKVMAVSVSRDLTVQVQEDVNAVKLTDRQQLLHAAVQRGEPKSLGVSQVMLGLMVISYSLPLLLTNVTDVVRLGVPWWSGLMFITAGVVAIVLDKHCNIKILQTCLAVSALSIVLSLVAVIIYSVDMQKNPVVPCRMIEDHCQDAFYATKLSVGLKSSLLLFTLAQMSISACQCFLLFRQRHNFGQYSSLTQGAPPTPQALIPPNLH